MGETTFSLGRRKLRCRHIKCRRDRDAAVIEMMCHRRETMPPARPLHEPAGSGRGAAAEVRDAEFTVRQTRRTAALLCLTGLLWGYVLTLYPASADRPGSETGTPKLGTTGDEPPWRRTKDGWEPAWWLVPPKTFHRPTLHPLWLLAGQMLSCGAVALTESRKSRRAEPIARTPRRPTRDEPLAGQS
ncbi:MAG: hypothetical protein GYA33_09450 [Thermogutta sp.]|nr:hypothetical protein [Thermogutta sp.]